MDNKATLIEKEMEQKRSWLLDYVSKNKSKDILSQQINNLLEDSASSPTKGKEKKASTKIKKQNISIQGVDLLGLSEIDVLNLINSLPGNWLSSLSYSNDQAPTHKHQSTGRQSVVFVEKDINGLSHLSIYNPGSAYGANGNIICHGCIQAHTSSYYPNKIPQKSVDSISKAIRDVDFGVFHSVHKDKLIKPGRSHSQAMQDSENVLWPTLVQTAYEAPFSSNKQDWQDATRTALMGMQYLKPADAEKIIEALSLYFSELDPEADMNQLIQSYQEQVKQFEFKILCNHIAELFQVIPDKGLKNFFKRWIKHLNQDVVLQPTVQPHIRHHVPSLRAGMALDDAKELGADLAVSLRVQTSNIKDKRKILHDLRASVRRFNDIWYSLDKKEQRYLRPKLLQIVHASLY